MSTVVKLVICGDIHRLRLDGASLTYGSIEAAVVAKLRVTREWHGQAFVATYTDEEGDDITIRSDDDVAGKAWVWRSCSRPTGLGRG